MDTPRMNTVMETDSRTEQNSDASPSTATSRIHPPLMQQQKQSTEPSACAAPSSSSLAQTVHLQRENDNQQQRQRKVIHRVVSINSHSHLHDDLGMKVVQRDAIHRDPSPAPAIVSLPSLPATGQTPSLSSQHQPQESAAPSSARSTEAGVVQQQDERKEDEDEDESSSMAYKHPTVEANSGGDAVVPPICAAAASITLSSGRGKENYGRTAASRHIHVQRHEAPGSVGDKKNRSMYDNAHQKNDSVMSHEKGASFRRSSRQDLHNSDDQSHRQHRRSDHRRCQASEMTTDEESSKAKLHRETKRYHPGHPLSDERFTKNRYSRPQHRRHRDDVRTPVTTSLSTSSYSDSCDSIAYHDDSSVLSQTSSSLSDSISSSPSHRYRHLHQRHSNHRYYSCRGPPRHRHRRRQGRDHHDHPYYYYGDDYGDYGDRYRFHIGEARRRGQRDEDNEGVVPMTTRSRRSHLSEQKRRLKNTAWRGGELMTSSGHGTTTTSPSSATAAMALLPMRQQGSDSREMTLHLPKNRQQQQHQKSGWITLNVGGTLVTTSLTTLCADPNSLLYTMFCGQYAMIVDDDDIHDRNTRCNRTSSGQRSDDEGNGELIGQMDFQHGYLHQSPFGLDHPNRAHKNNMRLHEQARKAAVLRPWKLDRDHDGHVLIDADYQYFMPVLNFLRYNQIIIPPNVSATGVKAVGHYFNVRGIIDHFNREKRQVIFSWGSGGSGELGSRDKNDVLNPTEVNLTAFHQRITDIALGANYSCVLAQPEGQVYTFGNGDWGQLGLGNPKSFFEKAEDKTPIVTTPTVVSQLKQKKVVSIACGYAYAMALTSDHQVYFWGNNNHGQSGLGALRFGAMCRKIEDPVLVHTLEGKEIIQLGCGSFFVVALGKDGSLYSWGLIDCVGLGTFRQIKESVAPDQIAESVSKDKRTVLLTPHKIALPTSEKVVGINAGQWHSCAITENGSLYTWGVGFQGRLGHGDKEPCFIPQRVTHAIKDQRIAGVACGSFHTVVRTVDGAVFCWGDNANGQCGTNIHSEAVTLPEGVPCLRMIGGGRAIDVSCGRQHTAVVMCGPHRWCDNWCCQLDHKGKPRGEHGQVYVFGESKAMGVGAGQKLSAAKLVPGMESFNIQKVVSGLYHTFVLAEIIPPLPES